MFIHSRQGGFVVPKIPCYDWHCVFVHVSVFSKEIQPWPPLNYMISISEEMLSLDSDSIAGDKICVMCATGDPAELMNTDKISRLINLHVGFKSVPLQEAVFQ